MAIKRRPVSPRQKMINLMYIVLLAMLALNVSPDVLNGFTIVEDNIRRSTASTTSDNESMYRGLDAQMAANPVKVKEWFNRARQVKAMSDSLYDYAEALKRAIVLHSDGADGNVLDIRNKDDLESSTYVMLNPTSGQGSRLYRAINTYRTRITSMITDRDEQKVINHNLATVVPKRAGNLGKNWQQYMFENTPTAAAVALLSKLQNDVRYAEGVALRNLGANIDIQDIRVNQLSAFVIPSASTVVQGGKFSAQIIMAAVDTTKRPSIYIGGRRVSSDGKYEFTCGRTGDFNLTGFIEMENGSGQIIRRNFSQKYSVVAPAATVSADLMNVLYAGYSNPMSVSAPGVPLSKIGVSMSGGSLTPAGEGKYIARPEAVGKDAVITVTSDMEGRRVEMGKFTFHVRKLPDPTAYIAFSDEKGAASQYKGGRPLSKSILMSSRGIGAAIDDGLLNIPFSVQGFETVFFDNMGNAVPEISNSSNFTERQRNMFRMLSRGRRFYITRIKATGPDKIERTLPQALEVIVN